MGGFVEWSDELSVGIEEIDEQHKRIFDLAHAMHVALAEGGERETAELIVFELRAYVEDHFADEERRMREVGYPGLAAHVQVHRRMTAKVDELLDRLRHGRIQVSEVHLFVVTWLMRHILDTDLDYRPHLLPPDAA